MTKQGDVAFLGPLSTLFSAILWRSVSEKKI